MTMLASKYLELPRCPYCKIDKPSLMNSGTPFETRTHDGGSYRYWRFYACARCGGVVVASAQKDGGEVRELYPEPLALDNRVEGETRRYLKQAMDSLHSPDASFSPYIHPNQGAIGHFRRHISADTAEKQ